jgi:hypothetical protein
MAISSEKRVILTESVKDLNQKNQDFASSLIFNLKTDSSVRPNHTRYRKTDFQTNPQIDQRDTLETTMSRQYRHIFVFVRF